MTASRADRIEAQVDRLAELIDQAGSLATVLSAVYRSGYDAGRASIIGGKGGHGKPASAPGRKAANSHLRVVR
ncbi:MAG TPA: hypothetical protein VKU39_21100 [Streptosporangiaceae bacterium]|nr:hypothetical protein [Streptosporangiaceae bacterium]